MKEINGKIDPHALAYVHARYGMPLVAMPCPRSIDGRIHPHVTVFLMKNGEKLHLFQIKPVYYEALNGSWRPLSEVLEHYGNRTMILRHDWDKKMHPRFLVWLMRRAEMIGGSIMIPSPFFSGIPVPLTWEKIHFTTSTFYPDPHVETTCMDASYNRNGGGQSFSSIHDGAGANANNGDPDDFANIGKESGGTYSFMSRAAFLFDTSALGASVTVSAATMSLFGTAKQDPFVSTTLNVFTSTPGSNTTPAASDYNVAKWGTTNLSTDISNINFSTSGYNDFVLNASGLAVISLTSITKLGTRESTYEAPNSAPGGASGGLQAYFDGSFAEHTGTTQDPKLVVTSAAAGPSASTVRRRIQRR